MSALFGMGGEQGNVGKLLKIVFGLLLAIVLLAGGAVGYVWYGMQPAAASGQELKITVDSGMRPAQIADLLEQNGIIRNGTFFQYYLKYKKEGSKFKAGPYAMKPGMTYDDIIAKLNAGDVIPDEMIRFTIPEGFTIAQMADKLSQEGFVDRETFLRLADDPQPAEGKFAKFIPDDDGLRHRLEGYLFPETYEFKKGSTEADMINRMLQELDKRLEKELPADWEQKLAALNVDFHQLMTIASLIEREVVVDEERALVAGVIYNRLNKGMMLQIDATVQYLFDQQKERLLNKDLKIESPYNTYLHEGLPPGPISSPSLASIQAALDPEPSDYLYYVTKKDGTHKHLFAKTYKEHLRNIQKSKKSAK